MRKQWVTLSKYTFSRLDWISRTVAPHSFLKLWNVVDCVNKCIYAYWITYHLWFMFSTPAARDSFYLKILAGEMKLRVTLGLLLILAGPSWQELARWQDLEDNSRPCRFFIGLTFTGTRFCTVQLTERSFCGRRTALISEYFPLELL